MTMFFWELVYTSGFSYSLFLLYYTLVEIPPALIGLT